MPRSWKCRAIPLPTLWAFVACYRENLYLYLFPLIDICMDRLWVIAWKKSLWLVSIIVDLRTSSVLNIMKENIKTSTYSNNLMLIFQISVLWTFLVNSHGNTKAGLVLAWLFPLVKSNLSLCWNALSRAIRSSDSTRNCYLLEPRLQEETNPKREWKCWTRG